MQVRWKEGAGFWARFARSGCLIAASAALCLVMGGKGNGAAKAGVVVGGNVVIETSIGDRDLTAVGDGARAVECVGAISGTNVRIGGNVTINGNKPSGCRCEGVDCPANQTPLDRKNENENTGKN